MRRIFLFSWLLAGVVLLTVGGVAGYVYWGENEQKLEQEALNALKVGDYAAALRLIEPMAKDGNRRAQDWLGSMYAYGDGVSVDSKRALYWFNRSSQKDGEHGYEEYNVAIAYSHRGNPQIALRWLERAAIAGSVEALDVLTDPAKARKEGIEIPPHVATYWQTFP